MATLVLWNIRTCRQAETLCHRQAVIAAKYTLWGDRIATATVDAVQLYDGNDGRWLVVIDMSESPACDMPLL